MDFQIKPITTMQEIHGIVEIQRQAWQLSDLEIVPTFEMKAVASVGIALVALSNTGTPIGYIYGFHNFPDNHYSHMMAVLPEWQGKGVGYALKKAHRDLALSSPHKVNNILWTVDPLLPNNAYLNFAKLGAVCSKYYVDYYGSAEDFGLYSGLPTDRFLITWPIRTQRVERRMSDYKVDRVSETDLLERSPVINEIVEGKWVSTRDFKSETSFSLQVPTNFQWLRKNKLETALDWRYKFRELCLEALAKGWHVIDYHSFSEKGLRRNYYEFSQELPK